LSFTVGFKRIAIFYQKYRKDFQQMSEVDIGIDNTEEIFDSDSVFFKPEGPLKNEMTFIYASGVLVALWSFVWIGLAADASGKWPSNPFGEVPDSVAIAWNDAYDKLFTWGQFGLLFMALFVASQIVWSYKAYLFTEQLEGTARKWRRGWTIGGWFTPIGFLFIPYLVIRETESLIVRRQNKYAWAGIAWFSLSWIVIIGKRVVSDPLAFDTANMDGLFIGHYLTGLALVISVLFAFIYFGDISSEAFINEPTVTSESTKTRVEMPVHESTAAETDSFLVEEQIRMLGKLHADGLLSDVEFSAKKADLLGRI
jgi:hypothetical protein